MNCQRGTPAPLELTSSLGSPKPRSRQVSNSIQTSFGVGR